MPPGSQLSGQVPGFRRRINEYAAENLSEEDLAVRLRGRLRAQPPGPDARLASELYHLEPYGVGNLVPTFIVYDADCQNKCISSGRYSSSFRTVTPRSTGFTSTCRPQDFRSMRASVPTFFYA